jgi:hypothetical protein
MAVEGAGGDRAALLAAATRVVAHGLDRGPVETHIAAGVSPAGLDGHIAALAAVAAG